MEVVIRIQYVQIPWEVFHVHVKKDIQEMVLLVIYPKMKKMKIIKQLELVLVFLLVS